MKIIITAGGTSEPIDKVRKITNMSKGTLGRAIASVAEIQPEIDTIYFLSPFSNEEKENEDKYFCPLKFEWIQTTSVQSVEEELRRILTTEKIDAVIHAMAVSDYTVDHMFSLEEMVMNLYGQMKIKPDMTEHELIEWFKKGEFRLDNSSKVSSKSHDLYIKLKPSEKIISKIKQWSPNTVLVGFKLLENVSDEHLLKVARELKQKNNCDYVFCNDIKRIRESGHQGYLVWEDDEIHLNGEEEIASCIVTTVVLVADNRDV